jgi:hypothetical protein
MMNATLFDKLIPLLIDETLRAASQRTTDSPLARLKFWYYDTCAPQCYFLAHAITESERQTILDQRGRNALYDIWDGTGSIEFDIGIDESTPAFGLLARVYEFMCSPEDRHQQASRHLAQQLSRKLNELDWSSHCPVTDDFVVYAQNGTDYGCDCYEDLCASVPEAKLRLLRDRRLLGPDSDYDYCSLPK